MLGFNALVGLCRRRRGDCVGMVVSGALLCGLASGLPAGDPGRAFVAMGAALAALGVAATVAALSRPRGGSAR